LWRPEMDRHHEQKCNAIYKGHIVHHGSTAADEILLKLNPLRAAAAESSSRGDHGLTPSLHCAASTSPKVLPRAVSCGGCSRGLCFCPDDGGSKGADSCCWGCCWGCICSSSPFRSSPRCAVVAATTATGKVCRSSGCPVSSLQRWAATVARFASPNRAALWVRVARSA